MGFELSGRPDGLPVTAGFPACGASGAGPAAQAAAAVTALYREHALGLTRLALAMVGDRQAAEDIVQDAFCGLHRRWAKLRDEARALPYVRSAVLNGCRSELQTGRLVAAILLPAGIHAFEGVAAAPGDRTFYLAGTAYFSRAYYQSTRVDRIKIELFRLTLGRSGRPGPLRRLPGPPYLTPFPASSDGLTTFPLAVSPDGAELAFPTISGSANIPGSPQESGAEGIVVQDTATGARRIWATWPASRMTVSSLSWAAGGRLGFLATMADAAVRGRTVTRHHGTELNAFMILNTAACGSSLTGASRLVSYGSVPVTAAARRPRDPERESSALTAGPSTRRS